MALATFIQDGITIDYTPVGATPAGTIVVVGDFVGVAVNDIAAGQLGALQIDGVFAIPKLADVSTGTEFTAGSQAFWDAGNSVAEPTSAGNIMLGDVIEAAGKTDTVVKVKLSTGRTASVADVVSAPSAITYSAPGALTSPAAGAGSGADATTFTGAQCDALRADVAAIRTAVLATGVDVAALRTTVANILVELKDAGAMASA